MQRFSIFRLTQNLTIREPIIVLLLGLFAVIFFAATNAYTNAYDARRVALGQDWFDRAVSDLQHNQAGAAVTDLRTALLYAPANWNYRLRLAEALTAAHRDNEALGYYQSLWQSNPSNGPVNLQLARVAVDAGQREDAERYFNGAIFGLWENNAADNRREALFEMINFDLAQKDYNAAQSQLVVLSANLPEDSNLHTRVGNLFLVVNDASHALDQFREALTNDPRNRVALEGAADAALRNAKYSEAKAFLERALHIESANDEVKDLLTTIDSVLSLDTQASEIHSAEKSTRIVRGFQIAGDRLKACAAQLNGNGTGNPATELTESSSKWDELAPQAKERKIQADADLAQQMLELSFEIERQARNRCGEPPAGPDQALLVLAQRHSNETR